MKMPNLALLGPAPASYSAMCRPAEHLSFRFSSQNIRGRPESSCKVLLFLDGITTVHELGSVHSNRRVNYSKPDALTIVI